LRSSDPRTVATARTVHHGDFVRNGLEDDVTVEELLDFEISTGQGRFKIATLLANAALLPVIKAKGDALAAQIAELESSAPNDDGERPQWSRARKSLHVSRSGARHRPATALAWRIRPR
jgi:hypothetical protein